MIVLCTAPEQLEASASAAEIATVAEAARLAGCRLYFIPSEFSRCETAENALAHIPAVPGMEPAVWIGFIPTPDVYAAIYDAALAKHIRLLNTPEQHRTAMEFDRFYPLLEGLTPESVVIHAPEQCAAAVERLGLPVFVKGSVKSSKAEGWAACMASSLDELTYITSGLLRWTSRSRGTVIIRRLVRLRYTRTSDQGFPAGREFRVFLHHARVLDYGYYWDGEDALATLTAEEERAVLDLARLAAERLGVPFLAVDIGQEESGRWIVIEVNDAQFSGHSQIPLLRLWAKISGIA